MNAAVPHARPRNGKLASGAAGTHLGSARRRRGSIALAAVAALAAGCGGGAGGTSARQVLEVNVHGRVVAGGIGGSTLEVYRVGDYSAPVVTTTTSTGTTIDQIGKFSFTLSEVPGEAMFLLVASGGTAHDEDEDGTLDAPVPNLGKVHALATAAQLDGDEVLLSALTDVVYHRARYFLQARYDDAYVARTCDCWATFVLRSSVAGGPAIDNEDVLAYDPRVHGDATFRPHQSYADYVSYILFGTASAPDAFWLSEEEISYQTYQRQSLGVDLVGDTAYVCMGAHGLLVVDVSDPHWFKSSSLFDTPGEVRNVQVVGTLAYVCDGEGGFRILDVSDATAPALVGWLDLGGTVDDLQVVGNRAYLTNTDELAPTLHVVDVSDPSDPMVLADFAANASPTGVSSDGDHAYLEEMGQIEVVDVGDPYAPVSKTVLLTNSYGRIDVAGGHLFLGSDDHLRVFSLASPESPQSIASVPLPGFGTNGIRVRGTQVLLARNLGVAIVDASDPLNPTYLGQIPTTSGALDVDGEGSLLVATESAGGFATLPAATPPPSGVVASVPLPGAAGSVDATPDRLYVTTTNPTDLRVFDSSNPLAPTLRGSTPLGPDAAGDLAVAGNVAFVAGYGAFQSFDVTNSVAPSFLDSEGDDTGLHRLALGTNVAYATSGNALVVFDVSDPASLDRVTSLPVVGEAWSLARDGAGLFVAAGSQGVFTYDLTAPAAPVQVGHFIPWAGEVLGVDARPGFAFATQVFGGWNRGTLAVLDTARLDTPQMTCYASLPGPAVQVVESGGFAYVGGWASGVHVVDVTDPSDDAVFLATIPVPTNVADLDVEGAYVYAVSGYPSGVLNVLRAAQVAVP